MMATVGRLAGALLAESRGEYYLVGNTKVPCDWAAAGFEPPAEIDALKRPFITLSACRAIEIAPPRLLLEVDGEALPRLLAELFLIERTGSVSERLLRLVLGQTDEDPEPSAETVSVQWLADMPKQVWAVVRDTVLRCS
jgi:hypothetical protein